MSTDNKALLRRWFEEVWNRGSVETIDEMLSSDAVIHGHIEHTHLCTIFLW